jgi:type I restriction-modification system DNA methylase subunit
MAEHAYASERDFVAQYLLPALQAALRVVAPEEPVDLYIEKRIDGGTADLSAERGGKGLVVIEAKFRKKVGKVERDIEPRDPAVIEQAVGYAAVGGYPYYATCNSKRLILFRSSPGVRAYECEVLSLEYAARPNWAQEVLLIALGKREAQLKAPDDAVVDTLLEAFGDIYPEIAESLLRRLGNPGFKQRYEDWLSSQGLEVNEETRRLVAQQTTYLQINKLLFYQAIRTLYPDRLPTLHISENEDVGERLAHFYAVVRDIDYLPVYQEDIFSEIPLTVRAEVRIRTLLDTIGTFDFAHAEADFIGRLYEKLIPAKERKRLGQFYTPPYITEFITRMTITDPNAKVLDPACGSGGFLVKSYQRLRELKGLQKSEGGLPDADHKALLSQLFGIDINQFPAHLSVVNLAIQGPKAKVKTINVAVKDFFDTRPGVQTLMGFQSFTAGGSEVSIDLPATLDVIVANPPYIRQELVGDKEKRKIKDVLEHEFRNQVFIGSTPKAGDQAIVFNKQSDIYVYFIPHALRYLKDGGKLGLITSDKWLEVGYGETLQKFLLGVTSLRCLVEIDAAVFPDLEVDTVTILLQKCKDAEERKANTVKFLRLKKQIPLEVLVNLVETVDTDRNNDSYQLNILPQSALEPGKWSLYFRAPDVFWRITENAKVAKLSKVARSVHRGVTTGCDPYFVLGREEAKDRKIEKRYLKACAPAGDDIKGLVIDPATIDQFFFMVPADDTKIRDTSAWNYIQHGARLIVEPAKRRKDRRRLVDVETIRHRNPWFSLPDLEVGEIIFPMWFRYRFRAFLNAAGAHGLDFYYNVVYPSDPKSLAAYLNSTPAQLCMELMGRQYSGMLHLKVYELQDLPVLDPSKLTKGERTALGRTFDKLSDSIAERRSRQARAKRAGRARRASVTTGPSREDQLADEASANERAAQTSLDVVVYDILGFTAKQRLAVDQGLTEMRELRRARTR